MDLYVEDPKISSKRWSDIPGSDNQTPREIADRCDVSIELGGILIPKFEVPKGETEKSYLRKLAYRGLAWRYGDATEENIGKLSIEQAKEKLTPEVVERAEYELETISKMGFDGYF